MDREEVFVAHCILCTIFSAYLMYYLGIIPSLYKSPVEPPNSSCFVAAFALGVAVDSEEGDKFSSFHESYKQSKKMVAF